MRWQLDQDACGFATDPATRLAYDIEAGADLLGGQSSALIIWCKDAAGGTVSSHSTSYHARFVETPETCLIDKEAGEMLAIDLARRGGRAVIVGVR